MPAPKRVSSLNAWPGTRVVRGPPLNRNRHKQQRHPHFAVREVREHVRLRRHQRVLEKSREAADLRQLQNPDGRPYRRIRIGGARGVGIGLGRAEANEAAATGARNTDASATGAAGLQDVGRRARAVLKLQGPWV